MITRTLARHSTQPTLKHASALRLTLLALALAGTSSTLSAMTLTEAVNKAFATDPTATSSLATRDADREAGWQERATYLPKISASGAYNANNTNVVKTPFAPVGFRESYNGWNSSIEFRQPLYRYDFFARARRANARDAQAELGFLQRQQALIEMVAERYIAVLQAGNELKLAEADANATRKSRDDTRKRYDVQLVPGTDLKEAQARDDLSQANLLSAQQSLEAARDALDESTGAGREPLSALNSDTALPGLDSVDPEVWIKRARSNNPSYLLAQTNYDVAKADVESRRSDALPTVDFVAADQRQDTSESRIGARAYNGLVGVEVKVPIFASGANLSRIREAQARLRYADSERNRIGRDMERQTRVLVRDVQTAQAQAQAYQQASLSAQAAEQATRYGYEAGKRTITDVLNAQSNTVQARRNLDQSRYNIVLKTLQLQQQVGDLNATDIAAIDQLLTPAL